MGYQVDSLKELWRWLKNIGYTYSNVRKWSLRVKSQLSSGPINVDRCPDMLWEVVSMIAWCFPDMILISYNISKMEQSKSIVIHTRKEVITIFDEVSQLRFSLKTRSISRIRPSPRSPSSNYLPSSGSSSTCTPCPSSWWRSTKLGPFLSRSS